MTKHTPGPWTARDETNRGAIYSNVAYPGRPIATASSYWAGDGPRADERQANACLIAAGPEMLAALIECKDAEMRRQAKLKPGAPAHTYSEERLKRVSFAIAKATGAE